jgi:DNA-binding NtrC family response regulator
MLAEMCTYDWPGNIRELKNYVHRLYIMADETMERGFIGRPHVVAANRPSMSTISIPVGTPLAEVDRRLILSTLELCGGVKKHAADVLGISLKTLYNRLEEYRGDLRAVANGEVGDDAPAA